LNTAAMQAQQQQQQQQQGLWLWYLSGCIKEGTSGCSAGLRSTSRWRSCSCV
jgi:hypothetical protein